MPNDNQKSVTNNQSSQTGNLPQVSTDDMPPVVMEDTTPPMLNASDLPIANTQTQTTPDVEEKEVNSETDSGSAAPSNDVVMPPVITTQKKKFAGGRVIATILGLFLLVGGLGAGLVLVDQNQNIQEKAGSCAPGCGAGMMCDGDGGCVPRGTTQQQIDSGDVDPISQQDSIQQNSWNDWQDDQQGVGTNNTSGVCTYASIIANVGVQNCGSNPVLNQSNCPGCTLDCLAGTCTILDSSHNMIPGSEFRVSGSSGGNDNPPPGTSTPITAQCQNIKAYSSTWTALTNTQLSQLKTGDSVNFCVAGSATGGSFNKARFTINGALQAETTTVRPSSTDFCQTYVIPAATKTFNVSAEINHVTLGWK